MVKVAEPFSEENYSDVNLLSGLVQLQNEYLLFHPDMRTLHTFSHGVDTNKSFDEGLKQSPLPREQLVENVASNREKILSFAKGITNRVIAEIADKFQLADLYFEVPPKIICSDFVHTKQEWSAGMEDGYYEIKGSFFIFRKSYNGRIDSRLRYEVGPVIHYDTDSFTQPSLRVFTEEVLHYLQWLHEAPREVLEKIIAWRAVNEKDPDLRSRSLNLFQERKLDYHFKTKILDSGILIADSDGDQWFGKDKIDLSSYYNNIDSSFKQRLAYSILHEASAKLMRLICGVSVLDESKHFGFWEEFGVAGWNKALLGQNQETADDAGLSDINQGNSIYDCYQRFEELSFEDFISELEMRNCDRSINDIDSVGVMVNQGRSDFMHDIPHFLGYTLGIRLFKTGNFNDLSGMQELSYRLFSPVYDPIERLRSLIDLT